MCPDPAARPRLVDSVAVVATVLVAALGALTTVVGASVAEPSAAHIVAVAPAATR